MGFYEGFCNKFFILGGRGRREVIIDMQVLERDGSKDRIVFILYWDLDFVCKFLGGWVFSIKLNGC